MVKDFPEIALKYSDGNVIFMEDDICFSSKFHQKKRLLNILNNHI